MKQINYILGLLAVIAASFTAGDSHAAFSTIESPFTGSASESWENFANGYLGSPQDIMGGKATIASGAGEPVGMFIYQPGVDDFDLEYGKAQVFTGDSGVRGMGLMGFGQQATILFSDPVANPYNQFGAYFVAGSQVQSFTSGNWGVEIFYLGGGSSGIIALSFNDGPDENLGELRWFGWQTDQTISKIVITGDFVAVDGLQVDFAPVPEPSTFIAGALLALPFGVQGWRYLRNRKRSA